MSKTKLIVIAVMMVIASVLIEFMGEQGQQKSVESFSSFFAGMLLAAGLFLFFSQFSKRKI
jgi:hypothetical protein